MKIVKQTDLNCFLNEVMQMEDVFIWVIIITIELIILFGLVSVIILWTLLDQQLKIKLRIGELEREMRIEIRTMAYNTRQEYKAVQVQLRDIIEKLK